MDEEIIYQVVNAFLTERIEREIEREAKKQKVENLAYEDEVPIRDKYAIETWLNRVADNAHQVSLNVSHVAKLTHSSSRASNVTDMIKQTENLHLLTTQTANISELDLAYTNATLSPIAEFLSLPIEGESKNLGEFLSENENYLKRLSDDANLRKIWQEKISQAYQPTEQVSHVLAKQIYFPIEEKDEHGETQYHLISPVKSSALAHKIYLKVREAHDLKAAVNVARSKKEWSDEIYTAYLNMGIISVTKSNHQNASQLNGKRSGRLSLFNAAPPKWSDNSHVAAVKSRSDKRQSISQFLNICYREEDCAELFKSLKNWLYFLEKEQRFLNAERKLFIAKIILQLCEKVFNQIILLQMKLGNGQEKISRIPTEILPFVISSEVTKEEEQQRLSQSEREVVIDSLLEALSRWISSRIGDKSRNKNYERLWISLMRRPVREFYAVMEV